MDNAFYNSLTPEEKNALNLYKDNPYELNNKLIDGDELSEAEENTCKQIDSAISKYSTTAEVILYRGTSVSIIEKTRKSDFILNKNYMSTSAKTVKALNFATDLDDEAIIEIRCPSGTCMALMEGNPDYGDSENERLLARGITLKIEKEVELSSKSQIKEYFPLSSTAQRLNKIRIYSTIICKNVKKNRFLSLIIQMGKVCFCTLLKVNEKKT